MSYNKYPAEMMKTEAGQKLYTRHLHFKSRCQPIDPAFESYPDFYTWAMQSGFAPGMKLYRIDEEKPWGPDNCFWVEMDQDKERSPAITGGPEVRAKWANDWNIAVNRIRKYFGLPLFPVEGKK